MDYERLKKEVNSLKKKAIADIDRPKDLNEAIARLIDAMDDADKIKILSMKEEEMCNFHFGLGMDLRNMWGLWGGESTLKQWLKENLGVWHPDDMSGILLDSLWRTLHGFPLDLEGQAKHYSDYWDKEK